MARLTFALLVLASMMMAGCAADTAAQPNGRAEPPIAEPARFTEDTGAIQGLLTDDQLLPLSGAEVMLVEIGTMTLTDPDGRFSFSFLPPGPVVVRASHANHLPRSETVDVAAGAVIELRIALEPVAAIEPYHLTRSAAGRVFLSFHLNLSGIYNNGVSSASPTEDDVVHFPIHTMDGLATAIGETSWRSTQALGAELLMTFNFQNWNTTNPPPNYYDYRLWGVAVVAGASPLKASFQRDQYDRFHDKWGLKDCGPEARCESQVYVRSHRTGQGLTLTSDQRFDAHYSEFFHQAAPPDFSALPDA